MKPMTEAHFAVLRRHMVEVIAIHAELASEELGKAALDPRVLAAMAHVPRHRFVPAPLAAVAYHDTPLPIGFDKTISQPFIVAVMTDLLAPLPGRRCSRSAPASATRRRSWRSWRARSGASRWSRSSRSRPRRACGSSAAANVGIRVGDGSRGWAEHAPFDKILVTAAAERAAAALVEQLRPGGRMVLPLGRADAATAHGPGQGAAGQVTRRELLPVRFSRLETMA